MYAYKALSICAYSWLLLNPINTGASEGHSSPGQAGWVAKEAEVGRLVLVHYPPEYDSFDRWIKEASASFGGPVEIGRDLQTFSF